MNRKPVNVEKTKDYIEGRRHDQEREDAIAAARAKEKEQEKEKESMQSSKSRPIGHQKNITGTAKEGSVYKRGNGLSSGSTLSTYLSKTEWNPSKNEEIPYENRGVIQIFMDSKEAKLKSAKKSYNNAKSGQEKLLAQRQLKEAEADYEKAKQDVEDFLNAPNKYEWVEAHSKKK